MKIYSIRFQSLLLLFVMASFYAKITATPKIDANSSESVKIASTKGSNIKKTMIKSGINMQTQKTFHDFTVKDIDGNDFSLASLRGKKVLVVNVASKCGLTPQYEELEHLYKKYRHLNFIVIGFPSNNFMGQEPGFNSQIKEFCTANYGVTFPMMSKISVKGKKQDPLYRWLTQKSENGVLDQKVTWNFQKFMIDEEGRLVDVVMPKESPMSDKIIKWITGSSSISGN